MVYERSIEEQQNSMRPTWDEHKNTVPKPKGTSSAAPEYKDQVNPAGRNVLDPEMNAHPIVTAEWVMESQLRSEEKASRSQKAQKWYLICLLLALVALVVVGGICGSGNCHSSKGHDSASETQRNSSKGGYYGSPSDSGERECFFTRCGTTWENATAKCGMACEPFTPENAATYVDSCVPFGESCFTNLTTCCACRPARCGMNWTDANNKCGMGCDDYTPENAATYFDLCAPIGEKCFSNLSTCCPDSTQGFY